MAIIKTIPWDDGSGDNIYLDSNASEGNQTVTVSSDANTGAARTKIITFATGVGNVSEVLTVSQAAVEKTQYTVSLKPYAYDTEHHSYYGLGNIANAYTNYTSTSYATINFTRGNNAETYIYFLFNIPSIPQDATIDSIELKAKAYVNTAVGSRLGKRVLRVCRGTEPIGAETSNMTTSEKVYDLDIGEGWTPENIGDLTLKVNVFRGTQSTSNSYYCYFFGATLTITYTV